MTPKLWAILVTAVIEIALLAVVVVMVWQNGQTLKQITAAVRVNVLLARRIEGMLRDLRESPRG